MEGKGTTRVRKQGSSRTWIGENASSTLTSLQRSSRCILQPQPTGPQDTRWVGWGFYPSLQRSRTLVGGGVGWVVPLCKEAVGVFWSSSPLCQRTLVGGGGPTPLQRSRRCILQPPPPADWASDRSVIDIVAGNGLGDPGSKPGTRSLGKVYIKLFPFQQWVNSRENWAL